MKIVDCLPVMTKMYLSRTVDSVLKDDISRGGDERLREQILQNVQELTDPARVVGALREHTMHRDRRILIEAILSEMLLAPDMAMKEERLFEAVKAFEQRVIDEGSADDAFKLSDAHALEIYQEVLEVALEDDDISVDEYRLLERLRTKLGVSRSEHRLLQARLGKFPKAGNVLHSSEEFRESLKRLQTAGVVLFCNQAEDGAKAVLPEEELHSHSPLACGESPACAGGSPSRGEQGLGSEAGAAGESDLGGERGVFGGIVAGDWGGVMA